MTILLCGLLDYWEILHLMRESSPIHAAEAAQQASAEFTELRADPAPRAPAIPPAPAPSFTPIRAPEPPATPAPRPHPPRLAGIIASPDASYAIFQAEPSLQPVTVQSGEAVGPWTVLNILADAVTIGDDKEQLVLRPTAAASVRAAEPGPAPGAIRRRDAWGRHIRPPTYLERRA